MADTTRFEAFLGRDARAGSWRTLPRHLPRDPRTALDSGEWHVAEELLPVTILEAEELHDIYGVWPGQIAEFLLAEGAGRNKVDAGRRRLWTAIGDGSEPDWEGAWQRYVERTGHRRVVGCGPRRRHPRGRAARARDLAVGARPGGRPRLRHGRPLLSDCWGGLGAPGLGPPHVALVRRPRHEAVHDEPAVVGVGTAAEARDRGRVPRAPVGHRPVSATSSCSPSRAAPASGSPPADPAGA